MSTFKHPVGPQPSKVYWRRRLIVGLGALAVIVVIVLIIVRPGSSSGEPAKPVTTSTSTPSRTASDSGSTSIPTSSAKADGAPCTADQIQVVPNTDASSYAADAQPQLSFSLTNTGTTSCAMDAGTATQVFTVTSGSEVYWTSTDCQTDPVHTEILLKPGKTLTSSPVAWDRTRSDPATCGAQREAVPAGGASYHLKVSVGGFDSDTTKQFLLN
jgi:hypothetical protein